MQRGEQRARFDVERAARDLLDPTRDAQAVGWLEQERAEDQQVERPLQQISLCRSATLLQTFCMRVLPHLQNVNRKACAWARTPQSQEHADHES